VVWHLDTCNENYGSPAVLVGSQVERLSKLIEAPAEELGTEGPVPSNTAASG
jgi:hypothetical protein